MKYLLVMAVFIISFLTLCNKETRSEPEIFIDTFGMIEFNTSKRASVETRRKPRPQSQNIGDSGVILLDFDGYFMSGTMFNTAGDKTMSPSGLTLEEQQIVLDTVKNRFSQFKIIVTDDERVFDKAIKRIRIVITESWEWFGQVGGVAYLNSFTWADETPAFVFSSLLNYNLKWIASASSHEAGHTLGLRHQSTYDENCNLIAAYSSGPPNEDWAPIMGVSYYKPIERWIYGQDSRGCNYWQNDPEIIRSKL